MKIVCWNLNHRLHCPSATAHVRRSKLKGSNPTAGPTYFNFQKDKNRPVDVLVKTCGARPQWSVERGLEAAWRAVLGVEGADTRINRKFRKYGRKKSSRYSTFLIIFSTDLAPFFVLANRVGENIFIN